MTNLVGQQFGNYQLIKLLGYGGFAEVYLGEHIHMGTLAAVKVLTGRMMPEDIARFRNEARIMIELRHQNIVCVFEYGLNGRIPFIVMEYAPQGSLRERLPKSTRVPLLTVVEYVKQVAAALQYIHDYEQGEDKNFVHRDVKPHNMLISKNNEILLSDFGIITVSSSINPDQFQEKTGTCVYMAPEQFLNKAVRASDQYALGITVYEWLCGSPPFEGNCNVLQYQHIHVAPQSLHERILDISPAVEQAVLRALAKKSEERYPSIAAFAEALEQAAQSKPSVPVSSLADLVAGVPLEHALTALRTDSGKPDRKWVSRGFLEKLRPLLSDPITAGQAEALKGYGFKRISEQDFLSWLSSQHQSLSQFLRESERGRQEAAQRQEEERP